MVEKHFCYQSSFGADAVNSILSQETEYYFAHLYGGNSTDVKAVIAKFKKLQEYFIKKRQSMCHFSKTPFDEFEYFIKIILNKFRYLKKFKGIHIKIELNSWKG